MPRVGAEHVHRALAERAVPVAPVELADARLRAEHALLHEVREHPHAVELHDLHADVRVGQLLADRRLVGGAVLLRDLDQLRELALERELLGEERGAALEAERGHRDLPAVVDRAEHVRRRRCGRRRRRPR